MARFTGKKIAVIAAAAALLIGGGGIAFAYWTAAGGSGTGTAGTGTSAAITVNQTSTVTAMHPGDTAQTLSGNFDNTNPGPVYVGTVTVSIASVFQEGVVAEGCDATDYTLAGAAMTVNAQVPVGSPELTVVWSGATIQFKNKADVNQDACQGATVNLAYAIS